MIRLVYALRKKPDLSREAFQEYWLNQHAPLVASVATDLNIHRYVQTHTLNDRATEAAQRARGEMEPAYDGVAELWWESEQELTQTLLSKAAQKASALLLSPSLLICLTRHSGSLMSTRRSTRCQKIS